MEVDDIISYHDVVTAEKASLQKGMNYGVGKNYSVFLMSLRENAPYADGFDFVAAVLRLRGRFRDFGGAPLRTARAFCSCSEAVASR